jgi:hypothetical protein
VAAGASCGHLPPKVPCCASAAMIGTAIPAIKVTAHFLNVLFIALSPVRFSNPRAPANGTAAGPAVASVCCYQKAPRVLPFVRRLKGATSARHGPWLEGSKPDRSGLPGLTAVNPGDAAGQASTSPHVRRRAHLAVAAAVELEDWRLNWAPVRAAICQRDCGGTGVARENSRARMRE